MTSKNLMSLVLDTRTVALFAGNAIAEGKGALKKEELVKVVGQALILNPLGRLLDPYMRYTGDYSDSVKTILTVIASEIVVGSAIKAVMGEKVDFDAKDLKTGLFQSIAVLANDSMK